MGSKVFHLLMTSTEVFLETPLSHVSFFPSGCIGCLHKREGRHERPRESRCFGHTVTPSPSLSKIPALNKINSASDNTEELDTLTFFKCTLTSLVHDKSGMISFIKGYLAENPQSVLTLLPIEHFSMISTLAYFTRGKEMRAKPRGESYGHRWPQ